MATNAAQMLKWNVENYMTLARPVRLMLEAKYDSIEAEARAANKSADDAYRAAHAVRDTYYHSTSAQIAKVLDDAGKLLDELINAPETSFSEAMAAVQHASLLASMRDAYVPPGPAPKSHDVIHAEHVAAYRQVEDTARARFKALYALANTMVKDDVTATIREVRLRLPRVVTTAVDNI